MTAPRTCPSCGAHLDAGEVCDCEDERSTALAFYEKELTAVRDMPRLVENVLRRASLNRHLTLEDTEWLARLATAQTREAR